MPYKKLTSTIAEKKRYYKKEKTKMNKIEEKVQKGEELQWRN